MSNAPSDQPLGGLAGARSGSAAPPSGSFEPGASPWEFVAHPEWIGPYRIVQILGEGAMGVVYHAEELQPVHRQVALKVIRTAHASRDMLARFETERQALAVMNHRGIAKVFTAGTTDSGQPYFAMELVRGLPITDYCDLRRLTIAQRVEVFIDVCHAVQHAHQKGVIHRDLKPSNVLVMEQDGRPQPKVIDFGVAKAVGADLAPEAVVTLWGQAIGTPAYMSPEQAAAADVDIDTRSDIYSLGVMLYELLVGQLPVDPMSMGMNVFLARLASRESNPPTASARVRLLGRNESAIVTARATRRAHLANELKGDLDAILVKALESDRSRRYETANALAMDLKHHLANEPISTRTPTATYRLRKFARRHRAGVAAVAIIVAVVSAGSVLSTIGLLRARRAERRAEREAAATRQLADLVQDAMRAFNPNAARPSPTTAREILDRGAERIRRSLADQPIVQAAVDQTIGSVYVSLGLYDAARPLLESALKVREHDLGDNDLAVAETLDQLGVLSRFKGDYAIAERDLQRALAIRRAKLPPADPNVAATLSGLASLRYREGRYAEAESLYNQVISLVSPVGESQAARLATALSGLGAVYWAEKRFKESEPLFQRALALQTRTLGPDHPDVARTFNNLGVLYWTLGRYADALAMYQRALASLEKTLDPTHPLVAGAMNNIGETYWKLRRYRDAEALLRRALAIKEQVLDANEPSIAVSLNSLAGLYRDEGRYAEAEPLYRRALAIREKAYGPNNSSVRETLNDYAGLLRKMGRSSEAASLAARAGAKRP